MEILKGPLKRVKKDNQQVLSQLMVRIRTEKLESQGQVWNDSETAGE